MIQLVNEERYKNFQPVLQKYIKNFHSTVAFVYVFMWFSVSKSLLFAIFLNELPFCSSTSLPNLFCSNGPLCACSAMFSLNVP